MGEPTPKQSAFLKKNGQPVPATAKEASAAINAIYKAQGIPEKPREGGGARPAYNKSKFNPDVDPPTDKMIVQMKKADCWIEGMTAREGKRRMDILANNNWRWPENSDTDDTLEY